MESSLFAALVNLGGGFLMAAVILLLHRDALKVFQSELREERAAHLTVHRELMTTIQDNHAEQKDVLARIETGLQLLRQKG